MITIRFYQTGTDYLIYVGEFENAQFAETFGDELFGRGHYWTDEDEE